MIRKKSILKKVRGLFGIEVGKGKTRGERNKSSKMHITVFRVVYPWWGSRLGKKGEGSKGKRGNERRTAFKEERQVHRAQKSGRIFDSNEWPNEKISRAGN